MTRLERLWAVVSMPCEEFARLRGLPPGVALQAQVKAAERLAPYVA